MRHSHFALSPDWDDAAELLATRILGRRTPSVRSPREDVRHEPEAADGSADKAGEMMGPVDYRAYD